MVLGEFSQGIMNTSWDMEIQYLVMLRRHAVAVEQDRTEARWRTQIIIKTCVCSEELY